ncbi:hypothetical protein G4Y73_02840 [Wenzhouxiangella sp. XN201]|uniref:hypothetical protein n=1 Tax=Wenzhouxiangella sp. XN201 TaxID=2710755 RepID=UPI0013CC9358|nr:hypothetical protein [Wenzhouxiangella sp. XN201]NEZ03084.1 hypothetical protein [Wenzhouxiangella sp. XN201]
MVRFIKALLVLSAGAWFSMGGAQKPADFESNPVRIADLGLESNIRSAIDLVGPDGGSAGRHRDALVRRLQCWIDGVEDCSAADLNDPRVRAMRRFIAQGRAEQDGMVTIHFPDRTRVMVRLEQLPDLDPNDWEQRVYEAVVLPDTVQAPGLPAVPTRHGDFEGFAYMGQPAIQAALERLKQRIE